MFVSRPPHHPLRYTNYILRIRVPSHRIMGDSWTEERQLECDTKVQKALDTAMEEYAVQGWQLHSVTPIKVEMGHDQAFLLVFSIPVDEMG